MKSSSIVCWIALVMSSLCPTVSGAQSLADYTAAPPFIATSVPPNILFIVDLSEAMLPAAYGSYPESTGGRISSNVTGAGLCNTNTDTATNPQPAGCPVATVPPDAFDPNTTYFGMFNPLRCYTRGSNDFGSPTVKASVNATCLSTEWDGNFLNWLAIRKIDLAKKVLIGGRTLSASNIDGTANTLLGEPKTGSDGSTATCKTPSSDCFRFVKATLGSGTRYPSSLPKDAGNVTYFGIGEGNIYVSNIGTEAGVFGASSANTFSIRVDLTTETNATRIAESTGLLQNLRTDNMRVGVMFTNSDNGKAATVFRYFDGNFNSSAITGIRNQALSGLAALGEGAYEALCYYRNSQGACYNNSPADFTASVGSQGDPFYHLINNQMVQCCKSFILMISSGQATGDGGMPDRTAPFGNLFSADMVGLSTSWLDDIAYYGKTHDIRDQASATAGYLAGTQAVTFYSVNAMGGASGASVLASAAKFGGFEDRNGNGLPDATAQTCTYPGGSLLGSGVATSSPEWDLNQDCIPDTYFEASQGADLKAKITQAIADILKRAASGTSVSVLASSATGDGAFYQAFFYPSRYEGFNEIKWTGYAQGLFIDSFGNLREDTDADGKLVYENDVIVRSRFDAATNEVKVDRFKDLNGDGQPDSASPFETVGLTDVNGIWEAGKQLALKDAATRTVLTWVDTDNDGRVDAGEQIAFSATNAGTLGPYLRAGSTSPYTAAELIQFIRGEQVSGLRDRQLTVNGAVKVWKLSDPIHSTPVVVGAPKERLDVLYGDASYVPFFQKYRERRQVMYVGANDGMLHAFNAGFYHRGDDPSSTSVTERGWFTRTPTDNSSGALLGEELWGFIPYQLLPHLRWLTQTDYTHVYYVDLKPKVTDARIFTPDADHPNGWGTILIGGFRFGGSCGACTSANGAPPMTVTADFGSGVETRTFYSGYFILDITNPEVSPKLLWSFSAPALGLTTSYPTVVRVNPATDSKTDNTNAKWFVVLGSGPTGYDAGSTQTATTHVLEMPKPWIPGSALNPSLFATNDGNAFMGDLITFDANLDYRADSLYMGDVIQTGGSPAYTGKMYRLTTGGGNPAVTTWGTASGFSRIPSVVLSTYTCYPSACASGSTPGPMPGAPTITRDESNKVWLFFGTGRFFSAADKTNVDQQYFYGVKDSVASGTCTETSATNCESTSLVDVSSVDVCIVCSGGTNEVTGVSGVTSLVGSATTTLQGLIQTKDGWVTTLPSAGERTVVSPTLLGGIVFFPTFVPSADLCSASGTSTLYALFYLTGSGYNQSVLGTEAVGANTNVKRSVDLGAGMTSQMAVHIGGQTTDGSSNVTGRVKVCGQSSTGALTCTRSNPPLGSWSRYISWNDRRT